MSNAAKAYAWSARESASPREIEAQALLKAAGKLQSVFDQWETSQSSMNEALLFNRKLWSILLGAAISDDNPQAIEVRQNIANIGTFVMAQTLELQLKPERAKLKPLIDINCNLAAGLSGRA